MSPTLAKKIGFWSATSIIIGSIIGSGVFMKPSSMAAQLGSPVWLSAVWIIAGIFTLFGALVYAELGAMISETGGIYVYFRKMFGELPAFLYGWAAFSVINTASVAAIAFVCAQYSDFFLHLPRFDPYTEQHIIWHLPFIGDLHPLENFGVKCLAVSLVVIFTLLNYINTKGMVMHCSSLSKSLSPGYRIGWVIPRKFFEQVRQIKRIHNISSPTLTQATIAHYLQHGRYEYHLKSMRKALYTQCLRYVQAIIEYFPEGTKVSRPHGGFILWVEVDKKIDTFKLRIEAMKHHISIVPGKIFSASCNYNNCMRLSFGKPWDDNADYGLMMLGKLIKRMIS